MCDHYDSNKVAFLDPQITVQPTLEKMVFQSHKKIEQRRITGTVPDAKKITESQLPKIKYSVLSAQNGAMINASLMSVLELTTVICVGSSYTIPSVFLMVPFCAAMGTYTHSVGTHLEYYYASNAQFLMSLSHLSRISLFIFLQSGLPHCIALYVWIRVNENLDRHLRIAMNKPELYNAANELQRKTVLSCLKEYNHKIKWNRIGDTAIDLGCGDGSVTVLVKNFAPCSYKKFVACDISEDMVKFADKAYSSEGIQFRVLDVGGDLPEDLKGKFNHLFSFYALHWVKDQEKAFKNVYNLMSDGGDCFITLLASTSIYTIYDILAKYPKWQEWLKRVDLFLSPYHNMKNPEKKVEEIMIKCGFKDIDVTNKIMTNKFDSIQGLKNTVQSVEPFNMPNEVFNELFKDYLTVGLEIGILRLSNKDNLEESTVSYDYANLIIHATK